METSYLHLTKNSIASMFARFRPVCVGLIVAFAVAHASPQTQAADNFLTWHGQGTVVLETGGDVLVIDPFFLQSPLQFDNPPRPASEVREALGPVALILLTHGHADHFGIALELLDAGSTATCVPFAPSQELTTPLLAGNSELVRNLVAFELIGDPCRVVDLNKGGRLIPGETVQLGQLAPPLAGAFPQIGTIEEILMVPAEHGSSLTVEGIAENGGEAVGYIVRFNSGFTLYHAGDTYVFEEMKTLGERYDIDLAILPVGGNFTMGPEDAAFAAVELLRARFVIPVHYAQGAPGFFSPALTGTPEEFRQAIGPRQNVRVVAPQRGERVVFSGAGSTANVQIVAE